MKHSNIVRFWVTASIMFALSWTGTLWHDFFGMQILPAITGSCFSSQIHNSYCRDATNSSIAAKYATEAAASPLPCSCPNHVHSPSCLSKAEHALILATARLVAQVLAADIENFAMAHDTSVFRHTRAWSFAIPAGPPIYLDNRALLI